MSYHYGQLELNPARGLSEWYRTHLKLIALDRRKSQGVYTRIPRSYFCWGLLLRTYSITSLTQCALYRQRRIMKSKKALGLRSQNAMLLRCIECAGKFEKRRCKYSNQHAPETHQWTDPQAHLCKVLSTVSPELKWVHPVLCPWSLTHY